MTLLSGAGGGHPRAAVPLQSDGQIPVSVAPNFFFSTW